MEVTTATFSRAATHATTPRGFSFDQSIPSDVWIVELSGPGQAGWDHTAAMEVVDANSGEIVSSSIGSYNEP